MPGTWVTVLQSCQPEGALGRTSAAPVRFGHHRFSTHSFQSTDIMVWPSFEFRERSGIMSAERAHWAKPQEYQSVSIAVGSALIRLNAQISFYETGWNFEGDI